MAILDTLTLANCLWTAAIILVLGSATRLFGLYVLEALSYCNLVFVELLFYSGTLGLVYLADSLRHTAFGKGMGGPLLGLTGCLAIIPCYFLTLHNHVHSQNGRMEDALKILCVICCQFWGFVAIRLDSRLIGFCAIGALFGALGFFAASLPFTYIIGFTADDVIPRCMAAAFYLLLAYVCTAYQGYSQHHLWQVFRPGVLGFGTFIYFLGWLIVSNRHYHCGDYYLLTNIGAFLSAAVAILFGGSLPELQLLQSVGGTFLGFLILEKYTEVLHGAINAWFMLGGGLLLWILGYLANLYPQYVVNLSTLG